MRTQIVHSGDREFRSPVWYDVIWLPSSSLHFLTEVPLLSPRSLSRFAKRLYKPIFAYAVILGQLWSERFHLYSTGYIVYLRSITKRDVDCSFMQLETNWAAQPIMHLNLIRVQLNSLSVTHHNADGISLYTPDQFILCV